MSYCIFVASSWFCSIAFGFVRLCVLLSGQLTLPVNSFSSFFLFSDSAAADGSVTS